MLISITDIQLIYILIQNNANLNCVSVLVYVAPDVDSLCTLKILTVILLFYLANSKVIKYTLSDISYLRLYIIIKIYIIFKKVRSLNWRRNKINFFYKLRWYIRFNIKMVYKVIRPHKSCFIIST